MKGIGSRVLLGGLVLGLSMTASAENYEGDGKLAFVGAGMDLYVREEPSVDSRAVAVIGDNGYVYMYGTTEDGWVAIKSGEATGYVKKERLITGKKAKKLAENMEETGNVYETARVIEPKETPWKIAEKKKIQEPLIGCQAWRAPEDKEISWQEELGLEDAKEVLSEVTEKEGSKDTGNETKKQSSKEKTQKKKKAKKEKEEKQEIQEQETEKTVAEEPQWQPEEYVEEPQWQPEEYVEEPQWQPEEYVEEPQWQPEEYVEEPQWQPEEYVEAPQWQPEEYVEAPQWQLDEYVEVPQQQPERNGNINGQDLVNYGIQFVGNPYVWGGTDPVNGSDCSGLMQSIYAYHGIQIPRVAADQMTLGYQIPLEQAQAGDLIFYDQTGAGVDHVGMYLGNGMLLHASSPETGVIVSDVYGIGGGPVGAASYDYSGYLY